MTAPVAASARTSDSSVAADLAQMREQLRRSQQQIDALQAQVSVLQSKIDGQAVTQSSTAAGAQAAMAKADQALGQATTANTAVAAQAQRPPALPDSAKWTANTSISGRMYFNASTISQKSNGIAQSASGTGFNIKRLYLGIDHKFDDIFSMNLTADINNVVGRTSNGNFNGNPAGTADYNLVGRGFYVKKAYVQAKINPALIVRLGAADLPWVPYAESQYGFRHIENVMVDRTNFGTSTDWGIHVLGELPGKVFSYQVSVVDGAGYRNPKVTRSVDVEGRISAAYRGFYGAVGGYIGKRGNAVQGTTTFHTAERFDGLIGYKDRRFGIGAEYFYAKDWNNVTTLAEDSSEGISLFGNVALAPKWSAFGRYEWVKPNRISNASLEDHYFNFGIQWEPTAIVDLALVYKRDAADNGSINTSNGVIGGAINGTYDEIGMFGQVRF
ncbi:MAG: hypothetical protein ABIM50_00710 [Novosphingobium sp.]